MAKKLSQSRVFVSMIGFFMVLSMIGIAGIITPLFAATSVVSIADMAPPTPFGISNITVPLMEIQLSSSDADTLDAMDVVVEGQNGFDPNFDFDSILTGEAPALFLATSPMPAGLEDVVLILGDPDALGGTGPYFGSLQPVDPENKFSIPAAPTTLYLLAGINELNATPGHSFRVIVNDGDIITSTGAPTFTTTASSWVVLEAGGEGPGGGPTVLDNLVVSDVPDTIGGAYENISIGEFTLTGNGSLATFSSTFVPLNGFNAYSDIRTFFISTRQVDPYEDFYTMSRDDYAVYGASVWDNGGGSFTLETSYLGNNTDFSGTQTYYIYIVVSPNASVGSYIDFNYDASSIRFEDGSSASSLGLVGSDIIRITVDATSLASEVNALITPATQQTIQAGGIVELFDINLSGLDGVDELRGLSFTIEGFDGFDPQLDFAVFNNAGMGTLRGVIGTTDNIDTTTTSADDVGSGVSYNFSVSMFAAENPSQFSANGSVIVPPLTNPTSLKIYAFTDSNVTEGKSFQVSLNGIQLQNLGYTPQNSSTGLITIGNAGGGQPSGNFSIVAYGPPSGSYIPQFAPVDFFFSGALSSSVINAPDDYFSIDPNIAGDWQIFEEYWGLNTVYRASFIPENGFVEGTTYIIKASKGITDENDNPLSVNLGLADSADFYTDLDSDDTHYFFNVTGGSESFGGNFPPMAWAGYPYEEMKQVSTALSSISVEFDRDFMDASTFSASSIYLTKEINGQFITVAGTTVAPNSGLAKTAYIKGFTLEQNSHYRVYVTRDVKDSEGTRIVGMPTGSNNEPGPYFYDFYTGSNSANVNSSLVATNLYGYELTDGVFQGVSSFESMFFSFSAPLDPSSISTANVSLSPALNCGATQDDYNVWYDSKFYEVIVSPNCSYQSDTTYTITWSNILSASGQIVTISPLSFITSGADLTNPIIQNVKADNYGLRMEFSENMNASTVTNKGNYQIKTRNDATDWELITPKSLANASLSYDPSMSVGYIDIALTPGYEFYLQASSNITDGAGNGISTFDNSNIFRGVVMDADKFFGGTGMKGMEGYDDFDMGIMGERPINVFPMSNFVGTTTKYFIDIPISESIDAGGRIEIKWPTGFNVSNVIQDYASPINNDFNGPGTGVISFANSDPEDVSSGAALNDGIGVIGNQTVVVLLNSATMQNDFLSFDLDQITNALTVKGPETAGWQAEIYTYDSQGNLLEAMMSMPFFTNGGGNNQISVQINGVNSGDSGNVPVILDSPMTGKIKEEVSVAGNASGTNNGTVTFSNLPDGMYSLFTSPDVNLGTMYYGFTSPEPIWIGGGETKNKTITLESQSSSDNKFALDVNLVGDFRSDGENDEVDIFAGSPNGFRRITVTPGNTAGSTYTIYLPDGGWNVGIGPALPDNFFGPIEMPDWPEPPHQFVNVWNGGSMGDPGSITFDISSASTYTISGRVTDGQGSPVSNVEVYAYQPQGGFGERRAKTDSSGNYVLSLNWPGVYTVGAWKPGLPEVKEKSIEVKDSAPNVTLNLSMKKPAYTITGKVKNFDGVAVPYSPVWTYEANGGYGWSGTSTDANGQFILYVDAGTWIVETDAPGVGWMRYQDQVGITTASVSGIIIEPSGDNEYYDISGNITVDGSVKTYTPLRAVQYNEFGQYTGLEFGGSTDSEGNYVITVPGDALYRVDTWLANYGEIASSPDEVANNPATIIVTNSDRENINITMGAAELTNVSIIFNNFDEAEYQGLEAFVNFEGFDPNTGNPTGYHNSKVISDLSSNNGNHSIKIKNGNYHVFVHIPGYGEYIPVEGMNNAVTTPGYVDIGSSSADGNLITINLPEMSELITVSGSVLDSDDSFVQNAWVWIGNPDTGYHRGTSTSATGSFSFSIPRLESGNYDIGADKPGYMSLAPQTLDLTDVNEDGIADQEYSFTLSEQTAIISGYIYYDQNGGTTNQFDSGEAVPYGWVLAENEDGLIAHAPVDGSGYYELGVIDGVWSVYGQADGFQESQYSINGEVTTIDVSGNNLSDKNIKLNARENWTKKTKKGSITPSVGGTVDDTDSSGTGVKLTLPANALGDSNSSGSVSITNTTAVARSSSSSPLGNEGKVINVTDANGQPITTLNSYIDLELVVWKSDIDADIAAGRLSAEDLLSAKLGYFDNSTNDWVSLETTRSAFYKQNQNDAEWISYTSDNASRTNYRDFIYDVLIDESFTNYADYKLVFKAKTDHLTTFSVTTSLSASVSSPSNESSPSRSNVTSAPVVVVSEPEEVTIETTQLISLGDIETIVTLSKEGKMQFVLGNQGHSLTLTNVDITGQSATLVIQSDPMVIDLKVGETKLIDVDGDGSNDLEIRLDEVLSAGQIKFTITSLATEPIQLEDEAVSSDDSEVTTEEKDSIGSSEEITTNYYLPVKNVIRDLDAEVSAIKDFVGLRKMLPSSERDWQIIDYLAYGSIEKTKKMSSRERKGLLLDFVAIYEKYPNSNKDWESLANIATGKTPSRILIREAAAIKEFVKVFNRLVDFKNPNDEAFVHNLAYSLRPQNRKIDAERAAINKFVEVYRTAPKTGYAWAIVRAIAYSGLAK